MGRRALLTELCGDGTLVVHFSDGTMAIYSSLEEYATGKRYSRAAKRRANK